MMEKIAVAAIVVAALAFVGRSLYRQLAGKSNPCSGCTHASCPFRNDNNSG
ncbi:MAG: FeoB-associated Cys-rich membrane protein [Planctomycetes bacterium]|nr:FeoB-associated Cys-rich membrane protein [Planctomycetota bacterium]